MAAKARVDEQLLAVVGLVEFDQEDALGSGQACVQGANAGAGGGAGAGADACAATGSSMLTEERS